MGMGIHNISIISIYYLLLFIYYNIIWVFDLENIVGRVGASPPNVWKQAEEVKATWPERGHGVQFGEAALNFARSSRNYSEGGKAMGFTGGRNPQHCYLARSMTRGMCLVAERMDGDLFADDTFSSVQALCPDEGDHCKPLNSQTCRQVQTRLGVRATLVLLGVFVQGGQFGFQLHLLQCKILIWPAVLSYHCMRVSPAPPPCFHIVSAGSH